MFTDLWDYLSVWAHWDGSDGLSDGLLTYMVQHLVYTGVAIGIAGVIAIPLGLLIGHTGRGSTVAVGLANASRALPTLGLMVLLWVVFSPVFTGRSQTVYILPAEIVLVVLAIPAILSGTYSGVGSVDPTVRDAARGMGMTGWQTLWRVEVPIALPLMFSGFRSATLQVIATATVGAYIGLGGLGRPIYDGKSVGVFQDNPISHTGTGEMLAGALLVTALALVVDLVLATIQRQIVSRGITGRYRRSVPTAGSSAVGGIGQAAR